MQELQRPNPDELLAQITEAEHVQLRTRGYLKVFLGYVAGVGKTYRMLHEALHMLKEGQEVCAAVVETHGRELTAIFLSGIPAIPKRQISYGGITLEELDLDEVLRRKPRYALVDELAHTNAPGSRHEKRHQDIEELLDAGINVYTCVNIQHLESLNDTIFHLTGVRVKETIPDRILEMADKIELVDLPTEELLKRLQAGDVYVPEKAKIAALKFFNEANLLGLRELALRYTADRVDDDMLLYKQEHGIKGFIPAGSKLLACVSSSPSSADIIRTAHRFASESNSEWFAVYVDSPQERALRPEDQRQLDNNLNLARELGATIVKLSGKSFTDEIIAFAQSQNVTLIVIGFSRRSKFEELVKGSIINDIVHKSAPIQVLVAQGRFEPPAQDARRKKRLPRFHLNAVLLSALNVGVTTGCGLLLRSVFEVHDIVLLFVVPIVLTSLISGLWGGVLTSIFVVLCFNFFFIPPFYTLTVNDLRFLLTFGVLLFVGIVTSFLADIVKRQGEKAKQRENFIQTLYEFSRKLLATHDFKMLLHSIVKHVSDLFQTETVLLLPSQGRLIVSMKSNSDSLFDDHEFGIAQWAYEHKKRAGLNTKTLASSQWQYWPLTIQTEILGVLAMKPHNPQTISGYERQHLLESFTNIVALSLASFMK